MIGQRLLKEMASHKKDFLNSLDSKILSSAGSIYLSALSRSFRRRAVFDRELFTAKQAVRQLLVVIKQWR